MIDLTIREPGVYDVPETVYHGQFCDGPSASRSDLWFFREQTPAHYWATSKLNPDHVERTQKVEFNFGAAAHALILEGDLPASRFVISPYKDFRTNEAKEWKRQQIAAGLAIVLESYLEKIEQMAEPLARHPVIKDGLFRGKPERSLFWKRKGQWVKSRPDVYPEDQVLGDYKTVMSARPEDVEKSMSCYGYHVQTAMAIEGLKETADIDIEFASLVVQEKEPPFLVEVYPIRDWAIDAGFAEYHAAHDYFCRCLKDNHWPGYNHDGVGITNYRYTKLQHEGLIK